jgi:hypothetical protein
LPGALAWGVFIWIAVAWGVRGAAGFAAEASPETAWEATIGFDGVYRTGSWTPLTVEYAATEAAPEAVAAWVEDPDGQFVRSPPARIAERADGAGIATARVRFGRPAGRLRIESGGAGGAGEEPRFVEVDLPPAIPATDRALLLIGDLPALEPALQRAWQATVRSGPGAALTRSDAASSGPRAWVVRTDGAAGAGAGDEPRDFDMFEAIVVCGRSLPRAASSGLIKAGMVNWFCAVKGVATKPGLTTLTPMPWSCKSM